MSAWEAQAKAAAEATGKLFAVGVRPFDKGWFATCDGIEWDGSTPAEAVKAVVRDLSERAARQSAEAQKERERALAVVNRLAAIQPRSKE